MLSPNPYIDCVVNTPPLCFISPSSSSSSSSPSSSDMDSSISPRLETTTTNFLLNQLQQQQPSPFVFAAPSQSSYPPLPLPFADSFLQTSSFSNTSTTYSTPVNTPTRPIPVQSVFEEPTQFTKKQKRSLSPYTSSSSSSSTHPFRMDAPLKCPKTPQRTPQRISSEKDRQFKTELKRRGSCSNHFEFIDKLGEGSYGVVYKVRKDGNLYALKKSKEAILNTTDRNRHLKELAVIKLLGSHHNIIKMIDAWEEGGHIYIQTELCESGSLNDLMENTVVTEESIWRYLTDILKGLEHIHSNDIMHLDIKPENLLLSDDDRVLIADFGISAKTTSTSNSSSLSESTEGDKVYMAPELLQDKFSPKADIFSLGITIFEMATGYGLPSNGQLWRDLRQGALSFPEDKVISQDLISIIKHMMHPDPNQRPTAQQLLTLTIPKIQHMISPSSHPQTPNTQTGGDVSCVQDPASYASRCPPPLHPQVRNTGRRKLTFN